MLKRARQAKSYHHGDLRSALVREGRRILADSGADGLSLREVARRCRVSEAAPYNHFADKQALLAAIATEGFQVLARHLRRTAERRSGRARILAIGQAYLSFALDHPALFSAMFGRSLEDPRRHPELARAANEVFALAASAIVEVVGGTHAGAHGSALGLWAMCHGAAVLLLDGKLEPGKSRRATGHALLPRIVGSYVDGLVFSAAGSGGKRPQVKP